MLRLNHLFFDAKTMFLISCLMDHPRTSQVFDVLLAWLRDCKIGVLTDGFWNESWRMGQMGQTFRLFISGDEAHDIISQIGDLVNKVGPKEPGHEIRAKELHFFLKMNPPFFGFPLPKWWILVILVVYIWAWWVILNLSIDLKPVAA